MLELVRILMNKVMILGETLEGWQIGIIVPIHIGDARDYKNYSQLRRKTICQNFGENPSIFGGPFLTLTSALPLLLTGVGYHSLSTCCLGYRGTPPRK